MIDYIVCFTLIIFCLVFIFTAEFLADDGDEEGVTLKYILRVIPHIPRHIWNILWVRGDEYHKSLDIHTDLMLKLKEQHQKLYIWNLELRRQQARNKSLKLNKRV